MDVLKLIKERRTIRKYKKKLIKKTLLNKIIEAGRESSSVHGYQPWKFVVITNKGIIRKISNILLNVSKTVGTGPNILIRSSSETISNAQAIIIVYNSKVFSKLAARFKEDYVTVAALSEELAIAASIQNMLLTAESLGIGSCWFATPLFCSEEIDRLLKIKEDRLLSLLSFGYPDEHGKRSPRREYSDNVRFIK